MFMASVNFIMTCSIWVRLVRLMRSLSLCKSAAFRHKLVISAALARMELSHLFLNPTPIYINSGTTSRIAGTPE